MRTPRTENIFCSCFHLLLARQEVHTLGPHLRNSCIHSLRFCRVGEVMLLYIVEQVSDEKQDVVGQKLLFLNEACCKNDKKQVKKPESNFKKSVYYILLLFHILNWRHWLIFCLHLCGTNCKETLLMDRWQWNQTGQIAVLRIVSVNSVNIDWAQMKCRRLAYPWPLTSPLCCPELKEIHRIQLADQLFGKWYLKRKLMYEGGNLQHLRTWRIRTNVFWREGQTTPGHLKTKSHFHVCNSFLNTLIC